MRPGLRQFTEINPVTFLLISQCKKTEKYVCKHAYNRNTCDNTTIVMCKLQKQLKREKSEKFYRKKKPSTENHQV